MKRITDLRDLLAAVAFPPWTCAVEYANERIANIVFFDALGRILEDIDDPSADEIAAIRETEEAHT